MIETLPVPDLLLRVCVAIATGGLIGLERERLPTRKFAGLRTLALLCGAGPLVVSVGDRAGEPALIGVYLALAGAFAVLVAYIRFSLDGADVGLTTSVTVFVVALLGALVGYGAYFESTSIAILLVALLAERDRLHRYVGAITDRELEDSLKLGALVFILYPILPSEPVDPYGVLALREVLTFTIFVLVIQFGAYVSMRQLGGSRGLALTGLLAGAANSFAAAGVLARLSTQSREAIDAVSAALLLATTSMIVRNVAIAVVLGIGLTLPLLAPTAAMVTLSLALAAYHWRYGDVTGVFDLDIGSPLSMLAAAKFAVAYVAILVVSVVAEELFAELGLYATAFAGGLVSSAAVSVTAATVFTGGTIGAESAAGMVVLGIAASLASKLALIDRVDSRLRRPVAIPLLGVGLVGLVAFVLI
ncbi:hypothetical protein C479_08073 [Halovivax asiaticus JCM 14624]|uniref:Uncharacterized protein n=1 Tax=Halovivax asiaticus JCM 14624 TaxID=1227490 RepID=M0BJU4_9EURY|nr:MgtC/SapB family protein [Halovivax asiaticus]ELZ10752.1 hypothetical protein C479_08073 [Halovivax asiaticus JCM 14624]